LGRHIRVGNNDAWSEIIGVVATTHDDGMSQDAPTSVYWPVMMDRFESEKQEPRAAVFPSSCALGVLARSRS